MEHVISNMKMVVENLENERAQELNKIKSFEKQIEESSSKISDIVSQMDSYGKAIKKLSEAE